MRTLILCLALLLLATGATACRPNDATDADTAAATDAGADVGNGGDAEQSSLALQCAGPDATDQAWIAYQAGGPTLATARVNVGDVSVDSRQGPVPVPAAHVLAYATREGATVQTFALVCAESEVIGTTFVPLPLESSDLRCEMWAGTEARDASWDPVVAAAVETAEGCVTSSLATDS
ncbi:MAG: hypothetical protein ACK2T6_01690 [Anaerolineae bacterium]